MDFPANTKVLFVFPHPDNEAFFCAGLIYRLSKIGINTFLYILTHGEASTLKYGIGGDLGQVRIKELGKSSHILGLSNYHIDSFPDGKITENSAEIKRYLEHVVSEVTPDYVFTFEPNFVFSQGDKYRAENHQCLSPNIIIKLTGWEYLAKLKALSAYKSQTHTPLKKLSHNIYKTWKMRKEYFYTHEGTN